VTGSAGGGMPIVYSSSTLPAAHVTSSLLAASSQIAWIRMPSLSTSTRRCARCKARNAVRGSGAPHGTSSDDGVPAVMWVTPLIGRNRS
jgi:hypothetical protein